MRRFQGLVLLLSLTTIAVLQTTTMTAQSTGAIQGTVTDPSGATVLGAQLTVRNVATGLERSSPTNNTGNYLFPALPAGSYRLEVRSQGFQPQIIESLVLNVSTVVTRNFQLTIAKGADVLTVTSEIPVVETSTISVGEVIDKTTVQQIPLNGRHIEELINLVPGTVIPPTNGFLTAPLRGQGSFGATTAGAREDTVNFQVNGVNLQDPVQNQTTFQPSINTVSEFKLLNSTFSSEYGHTSGSVMNVVTRSGGNSLHGEMFDFVRNEKLDAKNFFLSPTQRIGPFKRNNFGASAGGPAFIPGVYDGRDRTFWFFSYEGLRQRQGVTTPQVSVPTQAERDAVTDPTAQQLLSLIPPATGVDSKGNPVFVGSATAPVDIDQYTIDVAHQIGRNDRLHGYYAHQHDKRLEPLAPVSDSTIPGFGDARQGFRQILTTGETHVFSPHVVNDFRFGANRIVITFNGKNTADPTSVGFAGLTSFGLPEIQIQNSNLDFGGVTGFPQGREDTTYVFADDLSWLIGKHAFKFGTEVRKAFNNNFNNDVGFFRFTDFAHFQLGQPNLFSIVQGGTNNAIGENAYQFYAQDSYKLLSNLTLELGVRFERNTAPTERFNRFAVFDPATSSLRLIGSPGFPQVFPDRNNWMPRVGFSYDPFKTGKTVIRLGYGMFYDQPVTNAVTGLNSANPPFSNPISVLNPTTFANAAAQGASATTINVSTINRGWNDDYVQSYNFNIQQEITSNLGIMVGYFGSKSTHLRLARNLDQPTAGLRPFQRVLLPGGTEPCGAAPDPLPSDCRNLNVITEVDSAGNANYNALWASANRRVGQGLQFHATYQWSKSLDYTSLNTQGIILQDSFNPRGNYGPSDFDTRHHGEVSVIYDLPFKGSHVLPAPFIEGWQLSTILAAQSGNPVNLVMSGSNGGVTNVGLTVRPDRVGDASVRNPSVSQFFNPLAFTAPPAGQFGDAGRNSLVGPKFFDWDLSFVKNTRLAERLNLEFRSEFFNILNHPNFGQPGRVCTPVAGICQLSASFGEITSTRNPAGDFGSSRQIQFALKLKF